MSKGKIILIDYLDFDYYRDDFLELKIMKLDEKTFKDFTKINPVRSVIKNLKLEEYLRNNYGLIIERIDNFKKIFPQDNFIYIYCKNLETLNIKFYFLFK